MRDTTGQVEFITNGVTQGVDAIMISNNAGDQVHPAVDDAAEAGIPVVAWDSPIPSGENEALFVAQVDFDETGQVMADMALELMGDDGGEFASCRRRRTPPIRTRGSIVEEVLEADPPTRTSSWSTPCTATTKPTSRTTRRSAWWTRTRTSS